MYCKKIMMYHVHLNSKNTTYKLPLKRISIWMVLSCFIRFHIKQFDFDLNR